MKLKIVKSHLATKKYDAIFTDKDGKTKTIPFGAAGYSDYTIHHDKERKKRYILRHSRSEHFNDYMSRGSLSMHLLWGTSISLKENIKSFKKRFNLK
jgi:hypothetical protein